MTRKTPRRQRGHSEIEFNTRLYIYLSAEEKAAIQKAADSQGVSMSAYIAATAVQKAKRDIGE